MSIADDYEKMLERIDEGRSARSSTRPAESIIPAPPAPTEEEIIQWNEDKKKALEIIRTGCTMTHEWELKSGWVEFFNGRSFKLTEDLPEINDMRIKRYFQSHHIPVTKKMVQALTKKHFDKTASEVKAILKSIIINYRKNGKHDG